MVGLRPSILSREISSWCARGHYRRHGAIHIKVWGFSCCLPVPGTIHIYGNYLRTLENFGFSTGDCFRPGGAMLQEVVIEDAPCLERLLPLYGPATIRVINATLELSDGISELHLGTTIFQKMTAINLTTSVRTVKILVLDSDGPDLGAVVDFLKCFPCLERLYVASHPYKAIKNTGRYDPLHPIECVELHLKKVVVRNYGGKRQDVDFAKFFVLNAKVLREMEFGSSSNRNQKWLASQHKRLQLEKKASQDAQFTFKTTFRSDFTMNKPLVDNSVCCNNAKTWQEDQNSCNTYQ
uniref:FBD domain-containing protein n=1 Tax=Leersia perrieri TaxID=77586 RepID=A0A0D9WXQ7_9ORYZ